jgi:hypothetical protein
MWQEPQGVVAVSVTKFDSIVLRILHLLCCSLLLQKMARKPRCQMHRQARQKVGLADSMQNSLCLYRVFCFLKSSIFCIHAAFEIEAGPLSIDSKVHSS